MSFYFRNIYRNFLDVSNSDDVNILEKMFDLESLSTVFSIIIVTLILLGIILFYYFSIKKLKPNETPKGFAMLLFLLINYAKQLVFEILGPKFIKMTPYFLLLVGYILISNLIGITGIESPTANLTVTLSMGFVTFIGTFIIGFKYQRLWYLRKFLLQITVKDKNSGKEKFYIPLMINPLEIVGAVTPLISISLRLWGNIFAGSLILSLLYGIPMVINKDNPLVDPPNASVLVAGLFAAPINAYIDVLAGVVQTIVFILLTMVYWGMAKQGEGGEEEQKFKFIEFDNDCYLKMTNVEKIT